MAEGLPDRARVVIVGGGIIGCSVAYHLAKLGWSDVVLLERKQLTCGTTWHAAGLVGQLRATANLTKLAQYTTDLYAGLEAETGQATGFKQNGSISLATCDERFEELKRGASMARTFGLEVEVISISEIKQMHPLLNVESVVGGVFLPKDGQTNPIDTSIALSKGARMGGARVLENVKVTGIHQDKGRVTGVATDQGDIAAEYVVLSAGMWSREIGRAAGVNVPLHACEHFYILTDPVPGLPSDLPVMRDPDGCAYYKEDAGKLLLGAFEPNAKPWGSDGITEDFCFDELPEDVEHFMPILERAIGMVPALESVGIRKFFNGPESFTPDVRYMLGETPELRHLFVATGFNSIGIQSAGGAGKVLAEWIVEGHPTMDVADVDIRRMMPFQNNLSYIRERVSESLGLLYAMHWPYYQNETARGLRRSPFHDRLAALGACFGEVAGWERPNWFAPQGVEPKYEYSYKRQNWFPYAAAEHKAVREGVALFDQTSFAELLVQGRDAEMVLQRVCAGDMAVPAGRVVYTQWLNERGGIEADLTVTRLDEDAYMVVTAGAAATRDLCWLKRNIAVGLCHPQSHGPEEPRAARQAHRYGSVQPGFCLRHLPGDRDRLRQAARAEDHLRRRVGLGALYPHRDGPARLRASCGGGGELRPQTRRHACHGRLPPGEGLPPLGARHHRRGHAPGGRSGVRLRLRQEHSLHWPRCLAAPKRGRPHAASGAVRPR
jgi:4-methylaminobutanoate oxidase (formaldehyde-forming)